MKHAPTLIDDFVASIPYAHQTHRSAWWAQTSYIHRAKHFVLDDPAVTLATDMAIHSELLEQLKPFALSPFAEMIVAMPIDLSATDIAVQITGQRHLGLIFMVSGDRANVLGHRPDGNEWIVLDIEQVAFGFTYSGLLDALFLLLQSRRARQVAETPARRSISRGRSVRYFASSTITIDLSRPEQLKRCFTSGTHATPRRHQVMGHFVHRGGSNACAHPWRIVTRDPDDGIKRWECPQCDRKRTWRKAFERGDAGKGFVQQKYEVTA